MMSLLIDVSRTTTALICESAGVSSPARAMRRTSQMRIISRIAIDRTASEGERNHFS